MDGLGWTIEKNELVAHDEQADALKRFQENVLNPALNSAFVEPWNAVVSVTNSMSEKLHGPKLLLRKEEFDTANCKFLSTSWLVQSVSSGLAMLVPYSLAGKAAGGMLENAGMKMNISERTAGILASEASAQILGAAIYDAARETREGETHMGNALGGVTAFSTFAVGNALSKDLPLKGMLAMRTLAGAIGGSAQHAVSAYWSGAPFPSMEDLGKATVNGVVMSIVLPESQRALKSIANTSHESFGMGVPVDRFYEYKPQTKTTASANIHESIPNTHEAIPIIHEAIPLEHPSTYDFFVKIDSVTKAGQERARDDLRADMTAPADAARSFDFTTPTIGKKG